MKLWSSRNRTAVVVETQTPYQGFAPGPPVPQTLYIVQFYKILFKSPKKSKSIVNFVSQHYSMPQICKTVGLEMVINSLLSHATLFQRSPAHFSHSNY